MWRDHRILLAMTLLSLLAIIPGPVLAIDDDRPLEGSSSIFKGDKGFDLDSYKSRETLSLGGKKLDSPMASRADVLAPAGVSRSAMRPGGKKKMAISVLASALLPGLGELYLYIDSGEKAALYRAPVFMALDAYLWYGYKDNYDKGKDFKAEYEAYCDAHWSEERFLQQHPVCIGLGGCTDWEEYNQEGPSMQDFFFIYIPRELDREEYYENCGKYDAFAFGWDDWDATGWDGNYDTFQPWTPHRTEYWRIRDESDKYLVRADQHIMMAIINRVVSMLDSAWLAYTINRGSVDDGGLTLDFTPGREMSTVGVSYRF
ncbi:MAG: hypothetical protein KAV42_01800 [Candidatus Krumholzibacteria bacterium]|nr:hypothetical protein [Candidatus Krumholzibacteria bacterium]